MSLAYEGTFKYEGKIVAICGNRGIGKSALMHAILANNSIGVKASTRLALSKKEIDILSALAGRQLKYPDRVPIHSNTRYKVQIDYKEVFRPYYIDGFHLGLPNNSIEIINVPPYSMIGLSEAQTALNSRMRIPDWVSRFYEESRHIFLTILLDLQRAGLIDLNVREIVDIYVVPSTKHTYDKNGRIIRTKFILKVFDGWKEYEAYLTTRGLRNYKIQTYFFEGNIFDIYDSRGMRKHFVPREGQDFDYIEHIDPNDPKADMEKLSKMYPHTAPEGFYSKENRK